MWGDFIYEANNALIIRFERKTIKNLIMAKNSISLRKQMDNLKKLNARKNYIVIEGIPK